MSDYISRENAIAAAIEILEGLGYHMKHNERFLDEVEAAFEEVETVDVVPVRHGWWNRDKDGLVWCCLCGFGQERSEGRSYAYCPNCGARMDGDGE